MTCRSSRTSRSGSLNLAGSSETAQSQRPASASSYWIQHRNVSWSQPIFGAIALTAAAWLLQLSLLPGTIRTAFARVSGEWRFALFVFSEGSNPSSIWGFRSSRRGSLRTSLTRRTLVREGAIEHLRQSRFRSNRFLRPLEPGSFHSAFLRDTGMTPTA